MAASTILLLESDADTGDAIAAVLTAVGYQVESTADSAEAIRRAGAFAVVILDLGDGAARPGIEICREIRGAPLLAGVPVLCLSQTDDVEERVRFLEAGADDVMGKPFDPRELEARVEALLVRFQRSRDLAPTVLLDGARRPRRATIACFSPKGGVGTTTIAVNIAAWLATGAPGRVAIFDLDVQFGQVATHLNVKPRLTITELARDDQALREPELLRSYAERHKDGLEIYAAPGNPELGRLLTPEPLDLALTTARLIYDSVVIDAGSELEERTLAVLDRADAVVVPISPEIGALKALHTLLETLSDSVPLASRATFVLNHMFARDMLAMRQVQSSLGATVGAELPYDPGLYLKAVNEGIPVVIGAPGSPPARALAKLAAAVSGLDESGEMVTHAERRPGRLGGLLRH